MCFPLRRVYEFVAVLQAQPITLCNDIFMQCEQESLVLPALGQSFATLQRKDFLCGYFSFPVRNSSFQWISSKVLPFLNSICLKEVQIKISNFLLSMYKQFGCVYSLQGAVSCLKMFLDCPCIWGKCLLYSFLWVTFFLSYSFTVHFPKSQYDNITESRLRPDAVPLVFPLAR